MVSTRSTSPRRTSHRILVGLATAVLAAASMTIAPAVAAKPPGPSGPPTGSCDLQSKNDKIKHVIYVQFDNVHFLRDNPNVPSDLEQMPNLLNFIKQNGTLAHERPHGPDLAHGRRDPEHAHRPLPRPPRAGRLELVRLLPAGRLGRLLVDVQVLDGQHRRRQPGEQPADAVRRSELQHGQRRPGLRSAARRRSATRPHRGCRSRAPAATSATSASPTPSSRTTPRSSSGGARPTTLAAGVGRRRHEHQGRRASPGSPRQTVVIRRRRERRAGHHPARRDGGSGGTGDHARPPRWPRRTRAPRAVTVYATDPTGDMTKVFGEGSPEWNEGRASQIAPSDTAARALAQTDFVGIAIHCADPSKGGGICTGDPERADGLAPRRGGRVRRLPGPVRRQVRQSGDQRRHLPSRQRHQRRSRSSIRSASRASRASTACSRRTRSARWRRCRRPASR